MEALHSYLKANCRGRAGTVKGQTLEKILRISGNELRRQVNRLRRQGVPIASSRDGYFYAVTAGEVYASIRQLRRMECGLEAAIRGLEGALDGFGGAPAQAQRSGLRGERRSDEASELLPKGGSEQAESATT